VIVQPSESFQVIWIGWVVSWVAASLWSGRTEKRAVTRETWIYRIIIFAGAILIAPWTAQVLGERPSWQVGYYGACALVSVILMGLALTWWARIHLGCLWSSAITRKEKHRLIESGPYAFVRHPIYTGLIIALLATAAIEATLVALLGALLIALGLWVKARAEERFLSTELGPETYACYRCRVPMLVPFLPHR
jgi:protein-S-isoprenylcysteine O-methyltransferase Ste14